MKALILLIIMMTGCGASDGNQASANLAGDTTTDKSQQGDDVAPSNAMLVGSRKNMPTCTAALEGQLIYVKEESNFFYCDEDLLWTWIDLGGKDGKDGKDGRDGKDGSVVTTNGESVATVAGRDGRDGRDGKDGVAGSAAPVVDAYVWINPATDAKWFVAHTVTGTYYSGNTPNLLSDNYICPKGSHSPSDDEYYTAVDAGIWYKFSSYSPLLIGLGDIYSTTPYQYGVNSTWGTSSVYYLRVALAVNGAINDRQSNGVPYNSAKALCVAD